MAIIDKETGKPVDAIWRMLDKETDSEGLAHILGLLIDILHEKGHLSDDEVIELIPDAFRWDEASDTVPAT